MEKPTARSHPILRYLAFALVLAGLVVLAVLLIPMKERATMLPTATAVQRQSDTPPIDANAPTDTKTATFAMG